jgi:hypothetical protein
MRSMSGPPTPQERAKQLASRERQARALAGVDAGTRDEPPVERFDGLHTLLAKRAFWNAVMGIFFLPGILSYVALNHLREYRETPGKPSGRARAYAVAAAVLLPFGFLAGLAVVTVLLESLFCAGGPRAP